MKRLISNGHQHVEILVGRRNEAHIGLLGMIGSDFNEFPFLQDAQKPALHFQRQRTDFVHENRPSVGMFEKSGPLGIRTGERPLGVAEKRGIEEGGRHGIHVDRYEHLLGPTAGGVYGSGKQLLAGSGLARDQNRDIAGSMELGFLQHTTHGFGSGQDRLEGFGVSQCRGAALFTEIEKVKQSSAFQGAFDRGDQVFLRYRLDEVIISALAQAFHGEPRLIQCGHHNALRFRRVALDDLEKFDPIQRRHRDIDQSNVETFSTLEPFSGPVGVPFDRDVAVTRSDEPPSNAVQEIAFIVDDDDSVVHIPSLSNQSIPRSIPGPCAYTDAAAQPRPDWRRRMRLAHCTLHRQSFWGTYRWRQRQDDRESAPDPNRTGDIDPPPQGLNEIVADVKP